MRDPPHPGEILNDGLFKGSTINITSFAKHIELTNVVLPKIGYVKNGMHATIALALVT